MPPDPRHHRGHPSPWPGDGAEATTTPTNASQRQPISRSPLDSQATTRAELVKALKAPVFNLTTEYLGVLNRMAHLSE